MTENWRARAIYREDQRIKLTLSCKEFEDCVFWLSPVNAAQLAEDIVNAIKTTLLHTGAK